MHLLIIYLIIFLIVSNNTPSALGLEVAISDMTSNYPIEKIDKEYRELIREGQKLEEQRKLTESLKKYREALLVKRYENDSYYVLLDIGRVEYKLSAYTAAIKSLNEYIKYVEIEIKVDRDEMLAPDDHPYLGGLSEKSLKILREGKAEALIIASKAQILQRQEKRDHL